MGLVASFHLISERSGRQPVVLARLATDRCRLDAVDGLLFARTLGTGRGSDTGPSIDARRSALVLFWRDAHAAEAFLAQHPLPTRWRQAAEHWSAVLRPIDVRGSWDGFEPRPRTATPACHDAEAGPVAVLTRATVRLRSTPAFVRTSRRVAVSTGRARGLRAVVGVGERPIGRLGTFSVWDDLATAQRFASDDPDHRSAAVAARRDGWFSEEMFATFEPTSTEGTWAGVDPLYQTK